MSDKFTPSQPLNTAVLFLVFNRLDTTKQVFEEIKKAKPPRLYIAADGPRADKEVEAEKVTAVRDFIMQNIDWECDVETLFRDENLSCKYAVSGAIDWFFDNEEMGIILEDDVVPTQSFFWFCEKMLNMYKHDERIMMIGGTNYYIDTREKFQKDYFFSRHFGIWGWASWRRAWSKYDVSMKSWRSDIQPEDIAFVSDEKYIQKHFENTFDLTIHWDVVWVYTCLFNYGLCLTPSINMISNVGVDGAHASGKTDSHFLQTKNFKNIDDIKINTLVYPEEAYDKALHKEITLKAYRITQFRAFLQKVRLLNIAKFLKRLLSK
jgi:hypothetical protein